MRSVLDFDKAEVVQAVRAQRARMIALLEDLAEERWETIALPGWRVREVAAHVVSTDEAALTGKMFALGLRRLPMADMEAWNETQVGRWADRPIPAILHGLEVWGRRMSRALSALPGPVARSRIPTPFGSVSFLWLGMARVYDEWVHAEDVRRAVGLPSDDSTEAVGPVLRQLLAGIPYQTLPRIAPGATGTVVLSMAGGDLPPVGFDLGARRYGAGIDEGDGAIEADAAPLVMVAAGRDPWREAESAGHIRIRGERAPAEALLEALSVV
ncbi:MAG: maleylpyruvate isomerase family mycothiol-dependent enzyme [Acidobacteria bacterium]|nr:maleylpyruvate isomerase family mycothiol-dependent enzyme [Acidobacteriota bacterium]